MKEYKMAKGYAISIFICAPILLTSFVALLLMPFFNEETAIETAYFFCPLGLIGITLITIALLDTIYGKLIIDDTTIRIKSTLINRSLHFNEIKGFKTDDKHVYIVPKSKNKKRIKSHSYINNYSELIYWLSLNFKDLNQEKKEKEIKTILRSHDFGMTKEERETRLKKAKTVTKVFNIVGVLITIGLFFFSDYTKHLTFIATTFLIICILVIIYFKGLIRIDQEDKSVYPSILWAFLSITCGLIIKAIYTFNITDYTNVWLPITIIPILIVSSILTTTKELSFKKGIDFFKMSFLVILFSGTVFGSLTLLNGFLDYSKAQLFKAKIVDKYTSSGKTTSYSLIVQSWKDEDEPVEVLVTKTFYKKNKVGNFITINIKKGRFSIPYFYINE